MEFSDIVLKVLLPLAGIVALVVLAWLLVELIKTVKVARETLSETRVHLDPMMGNLKEMSDTAKPAVAKIDPLMDRVQLTIDSVNLEMMRVDEILEDVTKITDSASSAANAVDNLANAPMKAVNSATARVRNVLNAKVADGTVAQIPPASSEEKPKAKAKAKDVDVETALADFRAAEDADMRDEIAADPDKTAAMASLETLVEKSNALIAEDDAAEAAQAAVDTSLDSQATSPLPVEEVLSQLANEPETEKSDEA